jgi:uncharacterized lipoprotein YmbA
MSRLVDRRWTAVLAGAALLAGCASDATHFYTLLSPAADAPAAAAPAGFAIDVQRVRIPVQVDQPELVVRQGGGEVALVETRRWIGPLADEVRGALSAQLSRSLGAHDVGQVMPPAGAPVYRIVVDVQQLDGWLAHSVALDAVWTVSLLNDRGIADPARSWTCATRARQTIAAGYAPFVTGTQQTVATMAGEIGALISAAQRGGDPRAVRCPST